MSQAFQEGRILFEFPENWRVCRPGKSSYYRNRFQGFCGGSKETDFLLFEPDQRVLWLLEVKDYTTDRRTKTSDLCDEIALKVRDVLALLMAGATNDPPSNQGIGAFMATCGLPLVIKVVLHLEQPSKPSALFPGVKNRADFAQMLRHKVHCIDPHAKVVSTVQSHPHWKSHWAP